MYREKKSKRRKKIIAAKVELFKATISQNAVQTKQELENLISDFSEKAVYELNTLYSGFEKYCNARLNNNKQNSVTNIVNYNAAHMKSMCVCSVYECNNFH